MKRKINRWTDKVCDRRPKSAKRSSSNRTHALDGEAIGVGVGSGLVQGSPVIGKPWERRG